MSQARSGLFVCKMQWWRFDHYEIDGDFIRPTSSCRSKLMQYDLWKTYEEALGDNIAQCAHHKLLDLAERSRHYRRDPQFRGHVSLPPEMRVLILDYVHEFGLLGLALSRLLAIHYPPDRDGGRLSHQRSDCDGGWALQCRPSSPIGHAWAGLSKQHIGGLEPTSGLNQPKVYWHDLREGYADGPIDDFLRRYMPNFMRYPRDVPLPLPCSNFWWRMYAEPWHEFLIAANNLAACLHRAKMPIKPGDRDHRLAGLTDYTGQPRITFKWSGSRMIQRMTFHSMFSAISAMCIQDEIGGRRIRTCENERCSRSFSTINASARFCREQCRNAVSHRKGRKKAAEGGRTPNFDEA